MTLLSLVVAYLPGPLIFRLPVLDRARRASLPAEERAFWCLLLAVLQSSIVGFGLAALGRYRFDRLLWIDAAVSLLIVVVVRGRLRLGRAAPRPTWTALLPIGLAALGVWLNFFVPPAEYVMGGKDPGVYMNAGIQIAQRGALVIRDDVVATLPVPFRGLFFKPSDDPAYYSNRFMGFFLLAPDTGAVVGQFPHLYPLWVAIAYGVNGLSGARQVLGAWAVLGLLATYFLANRIVGRAAAVAAAGLLATHVVQIWYARYPNAEMVMQPLVLAGTLAYIRAQADDDRFFAPVAALLLVAGLFAHLTCALAIGAVAGAAVVAPLRSTSARLSFWIPLVLGTALAAGYLASYLPPYFAVPVEFVATLGPRSITLLVLAGFASIATWRFIRGVPVATRVRWVLTGMVAAGWVFAGYAYFFRTSVGLLAAHDADSLRTFASFYLSAFGLALALLGFGTAAWAAPAALPFFATIAAFSFFTFFKIRIIPEHFWAARRFVAVILPGALVLVGAAAFGEIRWPATLWARREVRTLRYALGVVAVAILGRHFVVATDPLLRHVEYAGLIPRLEKLAGAIGNDDLAIVEARAGSDVHVLALPLAYIYARHVLVLAETTPDKQAFRDFLDWARTRYRRVFFIGGGGTELLSRTMTIRALGGERFQIPEYESARDAYPRTVRYKEFDLGLYEFLPTPAPTDGFDLDVGTADDLYVRHFHAKEQIPGRFSFRWTRDVSYVSILGTRAACERLTIWASGAGRPPGAGSAQVDVFLDDTRLGSITANDSLAPYPFVIPAALAATMDRSEDAAQLRLVSRTWNPKQLLGVNDTRDLGVMVDRITVECPAAPAASAAGALR